MILTPWKVILWSNPPPFWNFLGLWSPHPPGISNSLRGGGLDIFWNHTFPWDACGTPTVKIRFGCTKGGNFIYPMMHRFILYYQASERTWCYQFNKNVTVEQQWKATCSADKTFCTFAVSINLRFSFTIPNISVVKSKRVFCPPIMS